MTEIKIEKKKPVWPWVLAALVIIVLLLLAFYFYDRKEEVPALVPTVQEAPVTTEVPVTTEAPQTTSLINVRENNSTVADFVSFVEGSRNMELDHTYTNQALAKLAAATSAMAKEVNYDVQADMDKVKEYAGKEYAGKITENTYKISHADSIRSAADISAGALQRLQQAKYPELAQEALKLQTASEAIKPDVLTLSQKDAVKGFFDEAADLLKKMN